MQRIHRFVVGHHFFSLRLETCDARTRAISALAASLPFAGRVRGL
jgi:hypothetical protein